MICPVARKPRHSPCFLPHTSLSWVSSMALGRLQSTMRYMRHGSAGHSWGVAAKPRLWACEGRQGASRLAYPQILWHGLVLYKRFKEGFGILQVYRT